MPTIDPLQQLKEAVVRVVNADPELRTLMSRTSNLIVHWESLDDNGPLPMIAYLSLSGPTPRSHRTVSYRLGFAVFAATDDVPNTICERLRTLLRYPAFHAAGAEIAQDKSRQPERSWPPAEPRLDDAAQFRADIDLSFIVPG
jgi:hypothetical protein